MNVITVIGAGQMGSALSFPARDNGREVRLVGTMLDRDIISSLGQNLWHPTLRRTLPPGVRAYEAERMDEALHGSDLVICGVSSFGVEWFAKEALPRVPADVPVLSVTKGMLEDGGRLIPYPHWWARQVPGRVICAIGGPCTSYELADRDHSHVCFCGEDMAALERMREALRTNYYHISLSCDVVGVECAVAVKNAYALAVTLAVGMSEARGMQPHYNSQAALFGQSVCEMRRLIAMQGGREENIIYGAGDLYVTIFGGRTRRLGRLLGLGMSLDAAMAELSGVTLESVVIAGRTADAVRKLIERGTAREADFPLLLHVDGVLNRGAPACDLPWDAFK